MIDKDTIKDSQQLAGDKSCIHYEAWENENVDTDILEKVCTALGCDVGDIMEMVDEDGIGFTRYVLKR